MSTAPRSTSTAASTSDATPQSRLYPSRPIVAASVAVFRDGLVLVATRTKPPAPEVFSLPGGLVEVGETLEEAALRELAEEVSVEARIVGFAGHVEVIDRDAEGRVKHHFIVNAFAGAWVAGEPTTGPEAAEVRFVLPDELDTMPTTRGLRDIVRKAEAVMNRPAVNP